MGSKKASEEKYIESKQSRGERVGARGGVRMSARTRGAFTLSGEP